MNVISGAKIEKSAVIPTWFGVGGTADAMAAPRDLHELQMVLSEYSGQKVRILGDGANLLVDDDGVDGLVVSLTHLNEVEEVVRADIGESHVLLQVGAGVNLPKLIVDTVRQGYAGLEGLAGIPASVGGALVMNAGGAFGQIADCVLEVECVDGSGHLGRFDREEVGFGYRTSGLNGHVITGAMLKLRRCEESEQAELRARLKECMAYKKTSQPMAERSAGCCFKNPTIDGQRISAGKLIDEAGCKGLSVGGAQVSDHHANFIVTRDGCLAADIIELMEEVRAKVCAHSDVELEHEVVIWRRGDAA